MSRLDLPAVVFLGALVVERGLELVLSRTHLRKTRGTASGSRPEWWAMIAVHGALLALPPIEASILERRANPHLLWVAIAFAVLAQGLRYWSILALGVRWNARAVVDPRLGLVERGPYRWIRHPNYLAVLIEFTAVPLVFGAWVSWIVLNLLHTPLIVRRIAGEERLLRALPGYRERMEPKGRFCPVWRRRSG